MVKKKRGRQCLPIARRQDNAKKKGRKEEAQKRNEAREKGEYENVSGALLS